MIGRTPVAWVTIGKTVALPENFGRRVWATLQGNRNLPRTCEHLSGSAGRLRTPSHQTRRPAVRHRDGRRISRLRRIQSAVYRPDQSGSFRGGYAAERRTDAAPDPRPVAVGPHPHRVAALGQLRLPANRVEHEIIRNSRERDVHPTRPRPRKSVMSCPPRPTTVRRTCTPPRPRPRGLLRPRHVFQRRDPRSRRRRAAHPRRDEPSPGARLPAALTAFLLRFALCRFSFWPSWCQGGVHDGWLKQPSNRPDQLPGRLGTNRKSPPSWPAMRMSPYSGV